MFIQNFYCQQTVDIGGITKMDFLEQKNFINHSTYSLESTAK